MFVCIGVYECLPSPHSSHSLHSGTAYSCAQTNRPLCVLVSPNSFPHLNLGVQQPNYSSSPPKTEGLYFFSQILFGFGWTITSFLLIRSSSGHIVDGDMTGADGDRYWLKMGYQQSERTYSGRYAGCGRYHMVCVSKDRIRAWSPQR